MLNEKNEKERLGACAVYETEVVFASEILYNIIKFCQTHMKHVYHLFTGLVLVSGIVLTVANGMMYTSAQLTGGGASLHDAAPVAPFIAASEYANAGTQMVMGILLILLGFLLHALLVARDERSVPITVVPRSRLQSPKWFWIEMSL